MPTEASNFLFLKQNDVQLVRLPTVEEQEEIVRHIETVFTWLDRITAEHANASRLLPRLGQAILAKDFRGELVPQDINDKRVPYAH
jgi:type I restriction enzyme S subunit